MAGMFTIGCKTCRLKGVRFTKRIMVAGRSFTKTWDERGIIERFPDSQEFLTKLAFTMSVPIKAIHWFSNKSEMSLSFSQVFLDSLRLKGNFKGFVITWTRRLMAIYVSFSI